MILILLFLIMFMCMTGYIHMSAVFVEARGIGSLELELWQVASHPMWVLGIEFKSSERAASFPND